MDSCDPVALPDVIEQLPQITSGGVPLDAVDSAPAAIIAAAWDEFPSIDRRELEVARGCGHLLNPGRLERVPS